MTPLHALARAAGLQPEWEDAEGRAQQVSDDSLRAVLAALELPAETDNQIAESCAALAEADARTPAFLTASVGKAIALPSDSFPIGAARLVDESGAERDLSVGQGDAGPLVPAIAEPGYYQLINDSHRIRLAVAPDRCLTIRDLSDRPRIWGASVQVPALRGDHPSAFGDFGSVGRFAAALAAHGADALAISPVHALFPADPTRFSPYAPSSRLFLNVLLADPAILGIHWDEQQGGDLIDWRAAVPARLAALRRCYDADGFAHADAVEAFAGAGGPDLRDHARFDALHAHFFREIGARGWQDWPAAFHDPAGDAVKAFVREHQEEVRFYLFLQWLADRSLAAAQESAKGAGMALGLITDLAVGMDPGGSHGWSRREDLLTGLSIGAPPDPLGPDGQDWGITSFSPHALRHQGFDPFIATIRAALAHAGGVRIDHFLGLRRLWVVPHGAPSSAGCYLANPQQDLFRLLALESHRAGAVVIGEDLGTVPPGLRDDMDDHAMMGMRVLWFERDEEGDFVPPAEWKPEAAAMTGTHDLPTVTGWWKGRDIDWTWDIGRKSGFPDAAAEQAHRADERSRLWSAMVDSGAAKGPPPSADDPGPAVDAATAHVAASPCALALFPAEDLFAIPEQPNLPGTTDQHPNWRRRLPDDGAAMLDDPAIRHRLAGIDAARKS